MTRLLALISLMLAMASPSVSRADSLAASASDVACTLDFKVSGLCSALVWKAGPRPSEESVLTLLFRDAGSGAPRDLGDLVLDVALFMPSMGHGSSPASITRPLDSAGEVTPGLYQVDSLYFLMPGDWQLILTLKKSRKVIDQVTLPIHL